MTFRSDKCFTRKTNSRLFVFLLRLISGSLDMNLSRNTDRRTIDLPYFVHHFDLCSTGVIKCPTTCTHEAVHVTCMTPTVDREDEDDVHSDDKQRSE